MTNVGNKKWLKRDILKVWKSLFIHVNNGVVCARAWTVSMFFFRMCMHEPLV